MQTRNVADIGYTPWRAAWKVVIIIGTPATRATARYQKKKGLISKSYKLERDTVDAFAEACENTETSQAKELTKFMIRFIKKHHPDFE